MRAIVFSIIFVLTSSGLMAQTFTLKSKDVGGQVTEAQVFNSFGCVGKNISPQLYWENAPENTQSFAITMYDPDAPTGSGWWHWVVFDIPKNVSEIKSNAGNLSSKLMPQQAIQSRTDFGGYGYGGPCPPQGDGFHKYEITIYALSVDKLGLEKDANPALVGFYLNSKTIEKATITMYFKRDEN
ncbi:hypothetical protein EV201_1012 [Ancylomarina subtilis]|uniref:PBP family phospholipid-binding protein n=1 Tax=Ancylomarina subtilis TaxID=1639035 RepID=A0A4Q7VJT8_9BACT|nr:YbhB/YbcL family Raf kinase inhibitor-like protein [Ancylomarina subtilis]RZT96374.1 hypothetical protein EV201_1012 [Ancylomarina subtilis]